MAKLPDFVIIGAMKCGTTVLWYNLNQHPQITMGKNWQDPKKTSTEIRFFNNARPYHNWKKGVEWYKTCFKGGFGGEKCANYIESEVAMSRMKQVIPNTKLILCVRNPVDRAYSEYYMQLHTLPEELREGWDGYKERGKYHDMLMNNVLPFFDKEQIYISVQELMKKNIDEEINKVYQFLGLPPSHSDVTSVSFKERDDTIDQYKSWDSGYEPMPDKTRKKLREFYKPHNDKMFEWLSYDIPEWK